jgi:hypothetical protein
LHIKASDLELGLHPIIEGDYPTSSSMSDRPHHETIAMLIDGDNAQASLLDKMVSAVSQYGTITIRRVYGDWTGPQLKGWKEPMAKHAFQPMQQFAYTKGKNSTDGSLIIDAMDLMYAQPVSCFCIASSDSDYTRLATRLREARYTVIGLGRRNTPTAFQTACNVFIYVEDLSGFSTLDLLRKAYEKSPKAGDWVHIGTLGTTLRKLDQGFTAKKYGYRSVSAMLEAFPNDFQVHESKNYVYMY